MSGIIGLSESLDSLGLLTHTVDDLRYVYAAFTSGGPPPTCAAAAPQVLVWTGDDVAAIAPEMSALVASIPGVVAQFGVETGRLQWSEHARKLTDQHLDVMSYEAFHERRREFPTHAAQLSAPLLELLRAGEKVSSQRHASVLEYRDEALGILTGLLRGETVIVGPATPGAAPAGLSSTGVSVLSRAWQLLGLPVVVVPGAQTSAGLPLGLQIVGLPGNEARMLGLGTRLEQALRSRYPAGT
jgi:Asp-tRNA(Asn)/Glu-tRNA(Gln) amidotransferase A subunit family amidase